MREPARLIDDTSASPAARELLRAAAPDAPSREERAALWLALEATIGPSDGGEGGAGDGGDGGAGESGAGDGPAGDGPAGGTPGDAGSSGGFDLAGSAASGVTATSAGTALLGTKLATWLGVITIAAGSVGTALLVGGDGAPSPAPSVAVVTPSGARTPADRHAPAPRAVPPAGAAATSATADAPAADPGSSAVPSARPAPRSSTAAPDPSPSSASSSAPARSSVAEEAAMTADARDLLAAGDASGALEVLERSRLRFSGGVLVQERAALTVEALGRSGQADRAASLARAFLDAWPGSTHAGRVRPWVR